jgi:hypothetical protein
MLVVSIATVGAQDLVRIPGTGTSLRPPPGFSVADRFPGFLRADLQSSITVTEVPAPAPALTQAMTREAMAAQGMTLLSSATEKVAGREGLLVHAGQSVGGTEYLKWILTVGDNSHAVVIVATYPRSLDAEVGSAIRASLLGATWTPGGFTDNFDGLTFRVTPTPVLKVAGRVGNMLILNESGSMTSVDPVNALYIVGSSIGEVQIGDLRDFAERRARQTTSLKDFSLLEERRVSVDGLAGHELVMRAADVKTGVGMRLYQVIVPEPGGYLIVQGLVGDGKAVDMLPEFRRVTETFRKTPAP